MTPDLFACSKCGKRDQREYLDPVCRDCDKPFLDLKVCYDDEHGLDLLIDNLHNVNLGYEPNTLSTATHKTRDGYPMEVQFNYTFGTYYVLVAGPR